MGSQPSNPALGLGLGLGLGIPLVVIPLIIWIVMMVLADKLVGSLPAPKLYVVPAGEPVQTNANPRCTDCYDRCEDMNGVMRTPCQRDCGRSPACNNGAPYRFN